MSREIILLHFGQAGVQMGSALWELFCIEHGLTSEGRQMHTPMSYPFMPAEYVSCLFIEGQQTWTPRSLMIDLEPSVIDEIRTGPYRKLWRPNCLITGKEDAANNFGRGNCTVGKQKMDETMESIRKLVENSHNLSAFETIHSHSGGTGSGMTSLIVDQLCDEYGKKFKFGTSVFPSPMYSTSTVDPYNAILHSHTTIDTLDCEILIDNQTMFERCTKNLGILQPSYTEINRLLAQMLSSVFTSQRFLYHGSQHADTTELLTNLIPYPRIHFPSLFYAPIVSRSQMDHDSMTIQELTRMVFSEEAQTLEFPCKRNAYISCAMLYRGVSSPKHVYDALQVVKGTPSIGASFVDWCPTGFKIGLNTFPPVVFPNAPLAESPRSVCMLAGNLGMREAWHRNNSKFDILFNRRSFVHWFVGEGVEESEFIEAREDMAYLEQDYAELMTETKQGGNNSPSKPTNRPAPRKADSRSNQSNQNPEEMDYPNRQSNNANLVRSRSSLYDMVDHRPRYADTEYGDWSTPPVAKRSGTTSHTSTGRYPQYPSATPQRPPMIPHTTRPQYSRNSWNSDLGEDCSASRLYRGSSDRTGGADASLHSLPRSANDYPQARTRRRVDDYGIDTMHSVAITSNDSRMQMSDISRPTIPRGVNMNYPRHSQAHTDTPFLPTEPIVRMEGSCTPGTVYSPSVVADDTNNTHLPTPRQMNGLSSDQAESIQYRAQHLSDLAYNRRDRLPTRQPNSSSWSIASAVSYVGRNSVEIDPIDDMERLTESEPFIGNMDDEVTDFSGLMQRRLSGMIAPQSRHTVHNESLTSGFGSTSQVVTPVPSKLSPAASSSRAHSRESVGVASNQLEGQSLSRPNQHHRHHHHHHRRRHHHHHPHDEKTLNQHPHHSRHKCQQNQYHEHRESEFGPNGSSKISNALVKPTGDSQLQLQGSGISMLRTRTMDSGIGQSFGDHQSMASATSRMSVVVKHPVFEVSVSDGEEGMNHRFHGKKNMPSELVLTPVLSDVLTLNQRATLTRTMAQ